MQLYKDLAIILRAVSYEERHKIVTALTLEHGQISAIAKNSIQSKRFGGSLNIFAASEWIFSLRSGSELYQLSEAQIKEPFENIQKNFTLLSLASTLNELMLKVAPQSEACPDLFRLHSNALSALNTLAVIPDFPQDGNEIAFLNAYVAKLLQWNGTQPRIQKCLECEIGLDQLDAEMELSCVIPLAGWICPSCRRTNTERIRANLAHENLKQSFLRLSVRAISDLQSSLCMPIKQALNQKTASKNEHHDLFKFLEALFIFHIPGFDKYPLKSLRFLEIESNLLHPTENLLHRQPGQA